MGERENQSDRLRDESANYEETVNALLAFTAVGSQALSWSSGPHN